MIKNNSHGQPKVTPSSIPDAYVIDDLEKKKNTESNVIYLPTDTYRESKRPLQKEPQEPADGSLGAIIIDL